MILSEALRFIIEGMGQLTASIALGLALIQIVLCTANTNDGAKVNDLREKTQSLTMAQIERINENVTKSAMVTIRLILDSTTYTSKIISEAVDDLEMQYPKYFNIIKINCNGTSEQVIGKYPLCGKTNRADLPAVIFHEPHVNPYENYSANKRNNKNEHFYRGTADVDSLFHFAMQPSHQHPYRSLMPLYSLQLRQKDQLETLKNKYPHTSLVVFVLTQSGITHAYKCLTGHYRDTIVFSHTRPDSSLAKAKKWNQCAGCFYLDGKIKLPVIDSVKRGLSQLESLKGRPIEITVKQLTQSYDYIESQEEFQKKVMNIHTKKQAQNDHPAWDSIRSTSQGLFQYFQTQLDLKDINCKNSPCLTFFPAQSSKKIAKKQDFHARMSQRDIESAIEAAFTDKVNRVTSPSQLKDSMLALLLKRKAMVIYYCEKGQNVPLAIRALSNSFQHSMGFYFLEDPPAKLISDLKIKSLPAMRVLKVSPYYQYRFQQAYQSGKTDELFQWIMAMNYGLDFNYDTLHAELGRFRILQMSQKDQQFVQTARTGIEAIADDKKYLLSCLTKPCMLLLYDGSADADKKTQSAYKEIKNMKMKDFVDKVYKIDANCHNELQRSTGLQVQDLPSLIYLDSQKKRFLRCNKLSRKSILSFFQRLKPSQQARSQWSSYNNNQFVNYKCTYKDGKLAPEFNGEGQQRTEL